MKNVTKILNHMIVWSTMLLLCQVISNSSSELLLFSLGNAALAGVCFVLRLKVKKMVLFMLSHLVCMAGSIYFIGILYGNGVFAFLFALTVLWSCILGVLPAAAWLDNPSGIYVGALIVIYVIHWIYKAPQYVKTWTVIATVVLFLIKQLYQNLEATDRFIDMRTMSTKINTKSVKSLSKQISLLYVGTLGVLLGILGVIGIDSVWSFLGKVGDRIMRFIVSLIPESEPQAIEKTYGEANNNLSGDMLGELAKESPIMQKIGEIVAFIGGIAIAVALVILLVRGIIAIYQYFGNRESEDEEKLVIEKLYVGKEKSNLKRGRLFKRLELSPAKKIRKIYKRNMMKLDHVDVRDFPYLNPKEQVDKLGAYKINKEAREEIREIYEKARYSAEKVTEADAKRIHAIM